MKVFDYCNVVRGLSFLESEGKYVLRDNATGEFNN